MTKLNVIKCSHCGHTEDDRDYWACVVYDENGEFEEVYYLCGTCNAKDERRVRARWAKDVEGGDAGGV